MFEEIQVTTSLFKIILPTIFTFIIGIYVGLQVKCSKHNYTAKLIIRGLPKMEELELRDLIIWLEDKVKELRDEYSKPLPSKTYDKIYTSRLMKRDYGFIPKSPHNPE